MLSHKLSRNGFDKIMTAASKTIKRNVQNSSIINSAPKVNEQNAYSTIDTSNVKTFTNQTKEWWNLDGEMKLLHRFNPLRVPFIRDGLVQCPIHERTLLPLKGMKILDVGCGGGILSEALARLGATVTGIDASKELIEIADEHKQINPNIADYKPTYIHTSIEDHVTQYSNYYNGVVASEVLEHVHQQELFVKSCVQATKSGGKIFFTTPNRTRLSQLIIIFAAENIMRNIPKGAHEYEKFVTPTELTHMLEKNNCLVEATYGVQYNPITKKWSFCQYQHLMYAIQAQKLS